MAKYRKNSSNKRRDAAKDTLSAQAKAILASLNSNNDMPEPDELEDIVDGCDVIVTFRSRSDAKHLVANGLGSLGLEIERQLSLSDNNYLKFLEVKEIKVSK